ncbi:bacteriorhodopsin [Acuticoccus sp.]|uniref:bacteriorhodopsin n=1 Tax=Acuticoccus sp. TaxID=1904378 RepID=UPI003B520394
MPFPPSDVVATAFAAATVTTFATGLLTLLGLSFSYARWRPALVLSGVAVLATALTYLDAGTIWLTTQEASAAQRHVAWFVVQPMQVAAVYVFARAVEMVPVGVFYRIVTAAILMVLTRYLGAASIFDPTLGVLLSIAFWLYILGELYFGAIAEAVGRASRTIRLGYFWIRLILTVGWAIYPILHFVDVVVGAGHTVSVAVLYTVADAVNLVAVALIVLAVAGQERA